MNQNVPPPPPEGGFRFPEPKLPKKETPTNEAVINLLKQWSKTINDMRAPNKKKPKEIQDEKLLIGKLSKLSPDTAALAALSSILVLRDRLILEIGDWKQRLEDVMNELIKIGKAAGLELSKPSETDKDVKDDKENVG
jgi:hypothetical protein